MTLNSMVQSLTPLPLLQSLQKYARHFNLRVRAKAAISIANCVSRMSFKDLQEFGLVPLVQVAANLLNDRLPQAREAARSMLNIPLLYVAVTNSDLTIDQSKSCFAVSNIDI